MSKKSNLKHLGIEGVLGHTPSALIDVHLCAIHWQGSRHQNLPFPFIKVFKLCAKVYCENLRNRKQRRMIEGCAFK
jgi:hypothetical protein